METYEVNKILSLFEESINDLNKAINPEKLESDYKKLNLLMQEPNFWSNQNSAKKTSKEATEIRQKLDDFFALEKKF